MRRQKACVRLCVRVLCARVCVVCFCVCLSCVCVCMCVCCACVPSFLRLFKVQKGKMFEPNRTSSWRRGGATDARKKILLSSFRCGTISCKSMTKRKVVSRMRTAQKCSERLVVKKIFCGARRKARSVVKFGLEFLCPSLTPPSSDPEWSECSLISRMCGWINFFLYIDFFVQKMLFGRLNKTWIVVPLLPQAHCSDAHWHSNKFVKLKEGRQRQTETLFTAVVVYLCTVYIIHMYVHTYYTYICTYWLKFRGSRVFCKRE